MSKHLNR